MNEADAVEVTKRLCGQCNNREQLTAYCDGAVVIVECSTCLRARAFHLDESPTLDVAEPSVQPVKSRP
jgi:hypothetical protein